MSCISCRAERLAVFAAILALIVFLAQWNAEAQAADVAGSNTISGTVRDADGKPVAEVSVSLSPANGAILTTRSDVNGEYSFSALARGPYTLRAEKDGNRASASATLVMEQGEKKRIDLAFQLAKTSQEQKSSLGMPEFSDEPAFTVAGVTDASNLGGHGSNTVMRTQESLAKDTVSLGSPSQSKPSPEDVAEEKILREKASAAPSDFVANAQLGEFLLSTGRATEAAPYLERARAGVRAELAKTDKASLHHLLGDIEENLGNSLDAVREYQRAAELDPSERYFFDWGAELLLHHAAEPAVQVFTKGNRLFPRSVRMLSGLGAAWYAQGSIEEATKRFCEASDLDPNDPQPYLFLGKLQSADSTHLDLFAEKLARFAKLQPENAMANYYYAVSLWKQRKDPGDHGVSTQVESLLHKAVQLDPKLGAAFVQLGVVYAERGDSAQAIAAYQKAVAASPESEDAHYRLAQAYRVAGKTTDAQKEIQLYKELLKKAAEESERRRHDVQQFVYTLRTEKTSQP
jgi:tetratricopeptide (TPR) repeat protein